MNIRKNNQGQILVNLEKLAEQNLSTFTRYNGGWIKEVVGVDTSHTNGYSIKGDFISRGINWVTPGLYIDCSKGGSRKNQVYTYTLFELNPDGSIREIQKEERNRDWAVSMWDKIEEYLSQEDDNPLASFTTEELEAELARRKR